ncbi:MAG: DNA polymerase III subunit delta [Clostridiales bacterium]|nr:DNA polymerase III subunit delta [Clostridiales bacterium]
MKTINEDIKTKNFKPLYLIYGEEGKLRDDTARKIEAAAISGDGLKDSFEGDFDPADLINTANTLSLFGGLRFISVKDSGAFSGLKKYEGLIEYFKNPNPDCVIVFNEKKVDKRSRVYKAFVKTGYGLECKKPNSKEIRAYIQKEAKAEGLKFDGDAFDFFISNLEDDFSSAENEFQKLLAYTMDKGRVTLEDTEEITTKKLENRIFDLVDAVGWKQPGKALDILSNLILMKEPPVAVLISIARQFRMILQYKFLSKSMPRDEAAKRMGAHPFVVSKVARQAGSFTNRQLLAALKDCRDLLRQSFSGNMDITRGIEIIIYKYTV